MMKVLHSKKFWVLLVVILGAGIIVARNSFFSSTKKEETYKIKTGDLAQTLTISGSIDADEHVTLRFQTSGRLAWVGVKEGDTVKKYQGIASLDQRELEKTLKKKLLTYMDERWDFEQAQDDQSVHGRYLYQVPDLTDAEKRVLEKAQFDLDSTVLDVEIATLAKEYANLWTPIDGIVTRIGSPYAGVNTTPSQAEFEIVNPTTIYFSATADQSDVISLLNNMPGELTLDSYPDATLSGTISNISLTPDTTQTGTAYKVKFIFPNSNADYKYRLGMTGDLTFETKKKVNVLYAPTKFITTQNGSKYVTVKRNGKAEKKQVTVGMETDSNTEITSGISPGETIYD